MLAAPKIESLQILIMGVRFMKDDDGSAFGAVLTAPELARLLGLSDRTVRDLTVAGVIPKAQRGRYRLGDAVKAYCASLRTAASGRGSGGLAEQRARQAKEQADALAMKNAALRGELLPAAEVEATWSKAAGEIRAGMLAIPARLGMRLSGLTAAERQIIEDEIRAALAAVSGVQAA